MDTNIVTGESLPGPVDILLPEHVQSAAQEAAPKGKGTLAPGFEQLFETATPRLGRKMAPHQSGGSVRTARVGKGVDGGEAGALAQIERCFEIGIRLAGEPGDDVR